MNNHKQPVIALTAGEPSGIGPDLLVMAAQQHFNASLVALGDMDVLSARADKLGLPLLVKEYDPDKPSNHIPGQLSCYHFSCDQPVQAGRLNSGNASHVIDMLSYAAKGCLDGEFDAIATAPVHKSIINDAGIPFSGHTELFGTITKAHPVMLLASGDFRVALATTHLPLRDVSNAITEESLTKVISILHYDLIHKYGIENPRILVCGLNPHAGEDGHLGNEEHITINPTIRKLKKQGMNLSEALPADTLFTSKYLDNADAVLAMYHDQGLPVLKHASFGKAVNITLGLPIIRTSVDHGTALDLAGTGNISSSSFIEAIQEAIRLVASSK